MFRKCRGDALLILPDDLDSIGSSQKAACLQLISTNKSIFSNREKLDLKIHQLKQTEALSMGEMLDFFEGREKGNSK